MYHYTLPVYHHQYNPEMELLSKIFGVHPRQHNMHGLCPGKQRWPEQSGIGSRPRCVMYRDRPEGTRCPMYSRPEGCASACKRETEEPKETAAVQNNTLSETANSTQEWQQVMELAGFSPDDVSVKVNKDRNAVHVHAIQKEKSDSGYFHREVRRTFPLPKNIEADDLQAKLDPSKGLLVLTGPQDEDKTGQVNEQMKNAVELRIEKVAEKVECGQSCDEDTAEKVIGEEKCREQSLTVPLFIGFNPVTGRMVIFKYNHQSDKVDEDKKEIQQNTSTENQDSNIESDRDIDESVPKQLKNDEHEENKVDNGILDDGIHVTNVKADLADECVIPSDSQVTSDKHVTVTDKTNNFSAEQPDDEHDIYLNNHFAPGKLEEEKDHECDSDFEKIEVSDVSVENDIPNDDSDAGFSVELNTSGFDPEKIQVSLEGSTITVKANQEIEEGDGVTVTRRFAQTLTLPDDSDAGRLQCRFDDAFGKLRITAPQKTLKTLPIHIQKQ